MSDSSENRQINHPLSPPLSLAQRRGSRLSTLINIQRSRRSPNLSTPQSNTPTNCYICYTNNGNLVPSPCPCQMLVHYQCLMQFISTRINDGEDNYHICTICSQVYNTQFLRRVMRSINSDREHNNNELRLEILQQHCVSRHNSLVQFTEDLADEVYPSSSYYCYILIKCITGITLLSFIIINIKDDTSMDYIKILGALYIMLLNIYDIMKFGKRCFT